MHLFGLGTPDFVLVAFVLLLFFGKDRLPDLARGIGQSIRELREGLAEGLESKETDKPNKK